MRTSKVCLEDYYPNITYIQGAVGMIVNHLLYL